MFPDGDCTTTGLDRRAVSGEREVGLPEEVEKSAELGELDELGEVDELSKVGDVDELGESGEMEVGHSASKRSWKSISSDRRVTWLGGAGEEISSTVEVSAVLAREWETMGLTLDFVWPMIVAKSLQLAKDEENEVTKFNIVRVREMV
ncbi:hypothetical protein MMC29_001727 [Sticta canariensis]|nr:hypothetical protein [Sticta canariensis]